MKSELQLMSLNRALFCVLILGVSLSLSGDQPQRFRTDADGPVSVNAKKGASVGPQWFQLVKGEFPPEGSAHAVSGELIQVDHLERRFQIRVDRNDSQDRSVWDLPLDAAMLPYGSIYYHGAPAALTDIPLGTHLHGLFYVRDPEDTTPLPETANNRKTPEIEFRRCFQLEDDMTRQERTGQLWKVESIDLKEMKLQASITNSAASPSKPAVFDLQTSTCVYQENRMETLAAIQPGQLVAFNLTWATLYGPGRVTEIWIDDASRTYARERQLERHRNYIRQRGLAGWVDAVDDKQQIVTITFFGGIDPKLFDEIMLTNSEPFGWPLSKPEDKPTEPKGTIAVARDSLMTYDPVNDRKGGNILELNKVPMLPGSSGVQIRVKCDMLLEGFRPKHIVRFFPATWKVIALPREEEYFGRE